MTNKSTTIVLASLMIFIGSFSASACEPCKPNPSPLPPPKGPPTYTYCPMDPIKFSVCSNLLNLVIGTPRSSECCDLLGGLGDFEAATCLCSAVKANVFGVNLDWSLSISLLITTCKKSIPASFRCA